MRWEGHVAQMWEKRNMYRILVGKPEGNHWEDQDVGGWTIIKWILER
jgi:predicted NUDIX family NTP pyrophosphohydrolase